MVSDDCIIVDYKFNILTSVRRNRDDFVLKLAKKIENSTEGEVSLTAPRGLYFLGSPNAPPKWNMLLTMLSTDRIYFGYVHLCFAACLLQCCRFQFASLSTARNYLLIFFLLN